MTLQNPNRTYIALLRGINVVGRHKVPMAQLRVELQSMDFRDVHTLLNSGNVIFRGEDTNPAALRSRIASHLSRVFGFGIPTWVLDAKAFREQFRDDPFRDEEVTRETRCYVTFTDDDREDPDLPFIHEEGAFRIIEKRGKALCSVLDISRIGTADVMGLLEKKYGKDITTRNWNTVARILEKLNTLES